MNHSLKNAPLKATDTYNVLTLPSNMTLTQSYEPQRDLLTGMLYKRGATTVARHTYTYDTLGRPLTRSTTRNDQTVSDSLSLASEVGQQRAFCKISIAAVYIIVKN